MECDTHKPLDLTIKVRKRFDRQIKRFPFHFKVVSDTWYIADRIPEFGMRNECKNNQKFTPKREVKYLILTENM